MKGIGKKSALVIAMLMLASCLLSSCAPKVKLDAEPPKSLKILAIGNSFSIDAMEFLYGIATAGGVEEVVLGNLYVGGCSVEKHVNIANADQAAYTYFKNTTGDWEETENYKMSDAIADEDWDYISMHQSSALSGISESYAEPLAELISIVREQNSDATLIWQMTWAYQHDCEEEAFEDYNKDQMTMYNQILACVKEHIEENDDIEIIIPTGTAIQNARTSFLGDTLTRDGFHLNRFIGRYIAGLTWFAAITNAPIEDIDYNPFPGIITDQMIEMAKEAVTNAVQEPYEITQSTFTEES
ncbi:MAG: DUF4886 domain-containing protein [Lachnospiraceae bacterium]|nr:DUF4886 domain-containing protein [Lachnospiraceae bacterium]